MIMCLLPRVTFVPTAQNSLGGKFTKNVRMKGRERQYSLFPDLFAPGFQPSIHPN